MNLLISTIITIGLSLLFYFLDKDERIKKTPKWVFYTVVGVFFGLSACFSTHFGTTIDGATINVRDAGPLCAGFLFSPLSGIIAGLIGGIHRWFSVYFGAGVYTRLACTIATICAGFIAAFVRKYLFNDKKPTVIYGTIIAILIEVFHMLMVFITHLNDSEYAYTTMVNCLNPMMVFNALAVFVSIFAIDLIENKGNIFNLIKNNLLKRPEELAVTIRRFLGFSMIFAVVVGALILFKLQSNFCEITAKKTLAVATEDIKKSLEERIVIKEFDILNNMHIGQSGFCIVLDLEGNIVLRNKETGSDLVIKPEDLSRMRRVRENTLGKMLYYGYHYYYMYDTTDDYIIITVIPMKEILSMRDMSAYVVIITLLMLLSCVFLVVYFFVQKFIVNNIYKINESLMKICAGELDTRINIDSQAEFVTLSNDINQTVDTLKDYIKKEEERMAKDLEQAKVIQKSALPTVYPNISGIKMYAYMNPAKEVGGDFYDFYMIDDKTLVILVADVSGKGIPGALFMMKAKTIIKSFAEHHLSLDEVIIKSNNELCVNNDTGMFVTVWMGFLNIETGVLKYINAGHGNACVFRKGEKFDFINSKADFVLAGMEDVKYKVQEIILNHGDQIFLYTDGVTEATSIDLELFGENRLKKSLNEVIGKNSEEQCRHLQDSINKFINGAEQFDDITMFMVHFN